MTLYRNPTEAQWVCLFRFCSLLPVFGLIGVAVYVCWRLVVVGFRTAFMLFSAHVAGLFSCFASTCFIRNNTVASNVAWLTARHDAFNNLFLASDCHEA
jgi:hypothetical protein